VNLLAIKECGSVSRSQAIGIRWSVRLRIIAAVVLASLASGTAAGAAAPSPFDKPQQVVRRPLPRDPSNPQARPRVSCFYFARLMVKEVDLGEKGAEQLSLLPLDGTASKPDCRRDNAANERVVRDWSGYFKGVKGDYVFFDADDGWNAGVGFAVFAADGRKLFEDVAKGRMTVALGAHGLELGYRRVYGAPCSLAADAAGCWQRIRGDTGLAGDQPPDCAAAYERERRRTPQFSRELLDDPTIVDYDVAASIGAGGATTRPRNGKALACRPAQ